MSKLNAIAVFSMLLIGVSWMLPDDAYAYLDPGSGSYLLQLIIAGLLAFSFGIKTFWSNVKVFFVNLFSRNKVDTQAKR